MDKKPEVPTIPVIPDYTLPLDKWYYQGVHVVLHFNKKGGDYRKDYQADVDPYPDEEDMENMILDNEIELHWKMGFKGNSRGVDNQKEIIHAKIWDI